MYKYNLLLRLNRLPHSIYQNAIDELPKKLGVSKTTFKAWKYIKLNEGRMIPADKLIQLAKFFGVDTEQMLNYTPDLIELSELKELRKTI